MCKCFQNSVFFFWSKCACISYCTHACCVTLTELGKYYCYLCGVYCRMLEGRTRFDHCGDTIIQGHRASSLLLTVQTGIVLMRRGKSFTGSLMIERWGMLSYLSLPTSRICLMVSKIHSFSWVPGVSWHIFALSAPESVVICHFHQVSKQDVPNYTLKCDTCRLEYWRHVPYSVTVNKFCFDCDSCLSKCLKMLQKIFRRWFVK
jgi:hypothetical protein